MYGDQAGDNIVKFKSPYKKSSSKMKFCFILLTFISLGLCVVGIVYSFMSLAQSKTVSDSFKSIIENWREDMVFDVTIDPNLSLPTNYYVEPWKGIWPGKKAGCYCPDSIFNKKNIRMGLNSGMCNTTEVTAKCVQI